MGVLGYKVGDPVKCMSSLIHDNNTTEEKEERENVKACEMKDPVTSSKEGRMKTDFKPTSKKGSFEEVMDILQGEDRLRRAKEVLRGDFLAKSSRAAQRSKREQVMAMARASVGGNRPIFPLNLDTIENVAAAIKAGGWTSGDQYLNELKLMHVEAGFEVTSQMNKLMVDCKRSLKRHRGPVKRAPEFRLDDIEPLNWMLCSTATRGTMRPALSYVWAVIWMLREIEVSAMRWKDVTKCEAGKKITIFIPLSKGDQQGLGVRRTLQCCMGKTCFRWCCWRIWGEICKAYRGALRDPQEYIFQDTGQRKVSKAKMVEGWARITNERIQGHSARRTGAMNYVRLGMPIQELAFLGRWKSTVVLTYAEDALQSEPANRNLVAGGLKNNKKKEKAADPSDNLPLVVDTPKDTCEKKPGVELVVTQLPKRLWVASTAYHSRERVWHEVEGASWDVPIETWSSICGWPFSRHSSKVALQSQLTWNQRKCKKCLKKTRGEAREELDASHSSMATS